jgi:MoaA/NifB/PqqE/SkfB family radical SAM enzyme
MTLRISLDHYTRAHHDAERGAGGFEATLEGLKCAG